MKPVEGRRPGESPVQTARSAPPAAAGDNGAVPDTTRLDVAVVQAGLADSRTRAAALIAQGRIQVNGVVARRSSIQVSADDVLLGHGADSGNSADYADYASRGGHKLAGALTGWPDLVIAGRRCLDAGASHGGFTDVLLRTGAAQVIAVDVGVGQLRPALATDERVEVRDGCNVRTLTAAHLGGAVDVTVCDLSFVSLAVVLPALIACTDPAGDLVPMVKPQFEVGRGKHARGGVVRSDKVRADAVFSVATTAAELGWGTRAVCRSVLPGPAGNVEFFLWLRTDAPPPDHAAIVAAAAAA